MKTIRRAFYALFILIVLAFIFLFGVRFYLFNDDVDLIPSVIDQQKSQKVMAVFAHPDDESYITELLRDAQNRSVLTALITFTPGDAGEQQPVVCQQQFLGDIRRAEVLKSGFALGVDYQHVLDYGDGTLARQSLDELTALVLAELNFFNPDLVVTFWPESGMTMHSDHMTIGKATQHAFRMYQKLLEGKNCHIAYPVMPPNLLEVMGKGEMNKLQPKANMAIYADAGAKIKLWNIHQSQKQFVKNFTGVPAWLLYRLANREYYYLDETPENKMP